MSLLGESVIYRKIMFRRISPGRESRELPSVHSDTYDMARVYRSFAETATRIPRKGNQKTTEQVYAHQLMGFNNK